jgi:hypothetical protein
MSVNPESTASRRFEAFPPQFGTPTSPAAAKSIKNLATIAKWILWLAAPTFGVAFVWANLSHCTVMGHRCGVVVAIGLPGALFAGGVAVALGFFARYAYARLTRRNIFIDVTSDGLTFDARPGEVFSFSDATLGPWRMASYRAWQVGTALHLRCGSDRFVLGGREHPIDTRIRHDAPPADSVDAWLWASDFDEVLTMVARRSGLDVHRPAADEPARCLLYPNLQSGQTGFWAQFKLQRIMNALKRGQALLAIDLAADAIRVIDPNNDELLASASPAQVTATPEAIVLHQGPNGYGGGPVLVVRLPGWQPLTITSSYLGENRFSWRGNVAQASKPADYDVNAVDWLTLVDKCGLTPYLEDTKQG